MCRLFAGLPVLLLRQLVAGFCKFHLFEKCARASFNYLEPGYAKDRKIKRVRPVLNFCNSYLAIYLSYFELFIIIQYYIIIIIIF